MLAVLLGVVGVNIAFDSVYAQFEHSIIQYFIPFDDIGLSLMLAVITSIISAVYPAYRASKLNIVDALRR